MANPRYVLIIDEGFDAELSNSVKKFSIRFGNGYNIALFSEAIKARVYQKLSPH